MIVYLKELEDVINDDYIILYENEKENIIFEMLKFNDEFIDNLGDIN